MRSLANYIVAYEETQSNRVFDFRERQRQSFFTFILVLFVGVLWVFQRISHMPTSWSLAGNQMGQNFDGLLIKRSIFLKIFILLSKKGLIKCYMVLMLLF